MSSLPESRIEEASRQTETNELDLFLFRSSRYYPTRGAPVTLGLLQTSLPANLYSLTWLLPSGQSLARSEEVGEFDASFADPPWPRSSAWVSQVFSSSRPTGLLLFWTTRTTSSVSSPFFSSRRSLPSVDSILTRRFLFLLLSPHSHLPLNLVLFDPHRSSTFRRSPRRPSGRSNLPCFRCDCHASSHSRQQLAADDALLWRNEPAGGSMGDDLEVAGPIIINLPVSSSAVNA